MKKEDCDTLERQLGDKLVACARIRRMPYLDPQDTVFFTPYPLFHRPTAALYRVNAKKGLVGIEEQKIDFQLPNRDFLASCRA
ncbi:hypothetical protein E4631_17960 [Hymenobacter sp. UV11]|uniref:hypothetical protein n=1 Tax=Hymenobacter sp. UV11 TaxID=1849735 RepID=UPI00105D15E8|nr:hypothetical protein [Hymenobacter sp. UV11]TDN40187.1 hypothetical protein A8B98_14970 [Hymenobacter sp. UV11]TFZ64873.1 hypothetical protein E4631_17960 [Hymenobacter sp. UV11]